MKKKNNRNNDPMQNNQNYNGESFIEKKKWDDTPKDKSSWTSEDKLKMREYYKDRRSKPKNKVQKQKKDKFDIY